MSQADIDFIDDVLFTKNGLVTDGSVYRSLEAYIEGVRDESEWISVEDRLPEDNVYVIVKGGIAYYRRGKGRYAVCGEWWTLTGERFPGRIIQWQVNHWMPLPTPPEE